MGPLSAPLCPAYRVPLLGLSPGPSRDMQPTMKFVMDTSKYWFKPSISREQGKRKHCVSGDKSPRNQVWVLLSRPWFMVNERSREGGWPADLTTRGNRDCSRPGGS